MIIVHACTMITEHVSCPIVVCSHSTCMYYGIVHACTMAIAWLDETVFDCGLKLAMCVIFFISNTAACTMAILQVLWP